MKRRIIISVVTILAFLVLHYFLKYLVALGIFGTETWEEMSFHLKVSILNYSRMIIVLLVVAILFKNNPLGFLGLKKDLLPGLLYGFLFTLPMFIGYGIRAGFNTDITLSEIHFDMILAGFYEEFMYRGFLFGILFYYAGWGFIPAVIIPSIFFGTGHLYQADTISQGVGIFIFTSLASAGFALFYVTWRSLWMVIFLHGFMDLAWDMFAIESNVTGDLFANIFRFTTLGIAIFFSARKMRDDNPLKGNWWRSRSISES
jgi:membrane protease YdiL (CAAX protease family)